MDAKSIAMTGMAAGMDTSRAQPKRLLDPKAVTVTLETLRRTDGSLLARRRVVAGQPIPPKPRFCDIDPSDRLPP